jgi:hypothetical protein
MVDARGAADPRWNYLKRDVRSAGKLWKSDEERRPMKLTAKNTMVKALPMMSTKWQETLEEKDKFTYDGRFVADPQVLGSWKTIDQVTATNDFTLGKKMKARGARLTKVTLKENGLTDDMMRVWSGDTYMDLAANCALKMTAMPIDGADYLFIEKVSFNSRKKGWTPAYYVLKRAAD